MSKIIEPLFLPTGVIALGMCLCIVLLLNGRTRIAKFALMTVFVFYYLLSTSPIARILISSLEDKAQPTTRSTTIQDVEVIVILGGGADNPRDKRRRAELYGSTWKRLWRGVELFYELDATVPLLYTGGSGSPFISTVSGAGLARESAIRWGIPKTHFWVETNSGNTFESGRGVKQLLDEKFPRREQHRVLLVTSAWHMPRAIRVFTRAGIEAIPAPCDYRTDSGTITARALIPAYEALTTSTLAIRESLALIAYWWWGRI